MQHEGDFKTLAYLLNTHTYELKSSSLKTAQLILTR